MVDPLCIKFPIYKLNEAAKLTLSGPLAGNYAALRSIDWVLYLARGTTLPCISEKTDSGSPPLWVAHHHTAWFVEFQWGQLTLPKSSEQFVLKGAQARKGWRVQHRKAIKSPRFEGL